MTHPLFTCSLCGTTCATVYFEEALWQTVAYHEAGHAAMQWLRLREPGDICLHPDGSGRSYHHGVAWELGSPLDHVLILLVGPVGEVGPLARLLPSSSSGDMDRVRAHYLPAVVALGLLPTQDPDEALQSCIDLAAAELFTSPGFDVYDALADALLEQPWLSADAMRAVCEDIEAAAAEEDTP